MIEYKKRTLANGLTVVVNRDKASKLAAVNILYKVGARNENPARTGFAHLFEHLMFRGTREIPNFDLPVQMACGDNNAFTNNDYTDFYITSRRTTSRPHCGSKATAWRGWTSPPKNSRRRNAW